MSTIINVVYVCCFSKFFQFDFHSNRTHSNIYRKRVLSMFTTALSSDNVESINGDVSAGEIAQGES